MIRSILLLIFSISIFSLQSQIIFEENFESGSLPAGWSVTSNATDGGWSVGTPSSLSSQSFGIPTNGSSFVAGTNDDACNCDKSADYLIFPTIDLSDVSAAVVSFDLFYGARSYNGTTEFAYLYWSDDNGQTWNLLETLPARSWERYSYDLTQFVGDEILLSIHYDDNGEWLYGIAIDNVVVEVPPRYDVKLSEVDVETVGETGVEYSLGGEVYNNGIETITSLDIAYTVNGGAPTTSMLTGLNIAPFSFAEYTISERWMTDIAGEFEFEFEVTKVNGEDDENAGDNTLSAGIEIFEKVDIINKIDEFITGGSIPEISVVADEGDGLVKPNDLDFFPILGKDELWIVNEETENFGGTTVTVSGASSNNPEFLKLKDGNSWHFMSLPTGIAFSENEFFGTSPGVQDANHNGGTFTGPSLWTSDPDIYAISPTPAGWNGTHMDMLHGTPFGMGIAHEEDNVYWVFDGWNRHIVRYDFVEDHGPGQDDHSDGIVRRYTEVTVSRDGPVPSHLILDKNTGWLYIADVGNQRVLRLDINSGNVAENLPLINEPLAEHARISNVDWAEIISDGLEQPSGIEIIDNRLLVGDYATGIIHIYDVDNNFEELGTLETGEEGLTGIKIGPDGNIWYTNRLESTLSLLEPGMPVATEDIVVNAQIRVFPNPTSGNLNISVPAAFENSTIAISDINGRQLINIENASSNQYINLSDLNNGVYILSISNGEQIHTDKIVVSR